MNTYAKYLFLIHLQSCHFSVLSLWCIKCRLMCACMCILVYTYITSITMFRFVEKGRDRKNGKIAPEVVMCYACFTSHHCKVIMTTASLQGSSRFLFIWQMQYQVSYLNGKGENVCKWNGSGICHIHNHTLLIIPCMIVYVTNPTSIPLANILSFSIQIRHLVLHLPNLCKWCTNLAQSGVVLCKNKWTIFKTVFRFYAQ